MSDYIETDDENALRAHILQKDDREELLVEVPEWNTHVLIKALSGAARNEYIAFTVALNQHKGTAEYGRRLWFETCRLGCMHPKTKKPIFKFADRDELMNEHNGQVIETLGRTVQDFSKLDGSVIEQARKNLLGIQNSTTITNSSNGSDETTGE